MKFYKEYEEYIQGPGQKLPGLEYKKLKEILKRCRFEVDSHDNTSTLQTQLSQQDANLISNSVGPHQCPVCDGAFFPLLLQQMSAVVCFFNESAQRLLKLHLASGWRKYYLWCRNKLQGSHVNLIQEGMDLITYATINAIAMRKILEKYDKLHNSKKGQAFKTKAQSMHVEILQSPWLSELMAFLLNLRETKSNSRIAPTFSDECCLPHNNDEKPSITFQPVDSVKIEIDMTCSICLDIVFDAVSLTCGHIFCHMCACKAASVTIVDGLKAADAKEKCPLCRKARVYEDALRMEELNILLSRRCPEYWGERLQNERSERIRQTKEHWDSVSRAFMGL